VVFFSIVGIGEIVLLPLDVLKIKRQTNPEAFRGRGLFKIISDEGMGLYRGASWTAARNAPGSFAVCLPFLSASCTLTDKQLAFRWLGFCKGIHLCPQGLQCRLMEPKLCRLDFRCQRFPNRFRPSRRDQDPYPEPQL
jgi:hypothetical protein